MNLEIIHSIFNEIATKHKAIKTFYTGLASEFNPDFDLEYPALLVDPVSITKSVREGFFQNNWNIVMEVIDDLPEDRSQDNINKVLDSTQKIVDQVLSRLMTTYNDKVVTFNNQSVRADFVIQDNLTALPLIDDTESNHTGWQVTFTITEQVRYSTCCNDDVYDA
jgi:hypothetical protein